MSSVPSPTLSEWLYVPSIGAPNYRLTPADFHHEISGQHKDYYDLFAERIKRGGKHANQGALEAVVYASSCHAVFEDHLLSQNRYDSKQRGIIGSRYVDACIRANRAITEVEDLGCNDDIDLSSQVSDRPSNPVQCAVIGAAIDAARLGNNDFLDFFQDACLGLGVGRRYRAPLAEILYADPVSRFKDGSDPFLCLKTAITEKVAPIHCDKLDPFKLGGKPILSLDEHLLPAIPEHCPSSVSWLFGSHDAAMQIIYELDRKAWNELAACDPRGSRAIKDWLAERLVTGGADYKYLKRQLRNRTPLRMFFQRRSGNLGPFMAEVRDRRRKIYREPDRLARAKFIDPFYMSAEPTYRPPENGKLVRASAIERHHRQWRVMRDRISSRMTIRYRDQVNKL